jgi:ABC-type antimicrobial peptide transport system permease subunit
VGAVGLVARTDLRRRWRGTVVVALLIGVVGAVVLSTLAGARRSESALRRFNEWSRTSNLEINPGSITPAQLAAFRATPGIQTVAVVDLFALQPAATGAAQNLAMGAPTDATLGTVVDRARVIHGRAANLDAPDEVDAGEGLASLLHLHVGSVIPMSAWTPAQVRKILASGDFVAPTGPRITLHVVGVDRRPLDLGERGANGGVLVLTPAFDRKYHDVIGSFNGVSLRVRTQQPSDTARVTAAAQRIWGSSPRFEMQDLAIDTGANDAIHVLAISLFIFAAVAAVAGVGAIAIVLTREHSLTRGEQPKLRALGATRRQLMAMTGLRIGLAAVAGTALAVGGALLASPLFPFGIARRADPDPGLHADWVVIGLGVLVIAAVIATISLIAAWRATRPVTSSQVRDARVGARAADLVATSGLPAPIATGVRLAVEPGSGDAIVPVRSALLGLIFGVLGLAAVIVFTASLDHLAATPRLYGWTFDFRAAVFNAPSCDGNGVRLGSVPGVGAMAAVCYDNITVDGHAIIGWGITPLRGDIAPELIAGRLPNSADEVALGGGSLRTLGKHIGSTVVAQSPLGKRTYRIVGQVVFPQFDDPQPLADGAWFTQSGFDPLVTPPKGDTKDANFTPYVIGDFSAGTAPAIVEARIDKALSGAVGPAKVQDQPVEVARLRQTSWFPAALAALLSFLALVAVGHALVTGTRRRRGELALLKALGFERRQVRASIAWQATVLALTGLVVGIPLGVATGIAIWRAVADGLGIVNAATVPLAIGALVPLAIIAVNVIAFFPARRAARAPTGVALRSE